MLPIQLSPPAYPEHPTGICGHTVKNTSQHREYNIVNTDLASNDSERIKQLIAEEVNRIVNEKFPPPPSPPPSSSSSSSSSSPSSSLRDREPLHPIHPQSQPLPCLLSRVGDTSSALVGDEIPYKREVMTSSSVCRPALDFKGGPLGSGLKGPQSKARLGLSSDAYTPGLGPRLMYSVDVTDTGITKQEQGQGQGQGQGQDQRQGGRESAEINDRVYRSSGSSQEDYEGTRERSRERSRVTQTSPRPLSDVIAIALSAIKRNKTTNTNSISSSSTGMESSSGSPDLNAKSSVRFPGRRRQFLDAETERISKIMLRTMSNQSP